MKNKDYVSQPKRPRRKAGKKPAAAPFPTVKVLALVLLIAAFAYFLYFLLHDDKGADDVVPAVNTSKTKKKPEKQLPPPPDDENWNYIDVLENKQVSVGKAELKDKGPFKLRCTTVRSKQRAEALKAKIAFAGYESTVQKYQGTSGLWYRVDLGPYDRKREAEKVRHAMKRNNINGCSILLWR